MIKYILLYMLGISIGIFAIISVPYMISVITDNMLIRVIGTMAWLVTLLSILLGTMHYAYKK